MSRPINNLPVDIRDIEQGLDRKTLQLLKQRFLDINQVRLQRTSNLLTDRQKDFLQLIPLLFHVNHPLLPGYLSNQVPAGVMHYTPDKTQIALAKTLARSFHHTKELKKTDLPIQAIFLMGSSGSVAQSDVSDIDLWVCYAPDLRAMERQALQEKSDLISAWAMKHLHLTLHVFLMQSDSFKAEKSLAFDNESSGTAQYYLLLDEFYRTALWLAGQLPLWWFVPVEREADYDYFAEILLQKRFIKSTDVIDFGGIHKIPSSEFLGAGIWQLYKAIESPYKSILKLFLLETYALQEDSNIPLALDYKKAIYSGVLDPDQLDPYVLIYRRIEQYLEQNSQRLEFARRCFYIKVNCSLSKQKATSWQSLLMQNLVDEWHWNQDYLLTLDERHTWKAAQLISERQQLVTELNRSYELVNDLHRRLGLSASIDQDELKVLGRKLYAAFERRAGKIDLINPGISKDLHESELWFVQLHNSGTDSWGLYIRSPDESTSDVAAIRNAANLLELVIWGYTNGLLTASTRAHFRANLFQQTFSITQLFHDVKQCLPDTILTISHDAYHQPAVITQFIVFANLGKESRIDHVKQGWNLISNQSDALGYSGFRENLVASLDIVLINSWGEILCRHFEQDALLQAMSLYLYLSKKQQGTNAKVSFYAYGAKSNIIHQRLEQLWKSFQAAMLHNGAPNEMEISSRFLFEMGNQYILLESSSENELKISRCQNQLELYQLLSVSQKQISYLSIDNLALRSTALPLIFRHFSPDKIQLFYQIHQQEVDIYFLDNRGALVSYRRNFSSENSLLRPLCYFLSRLLQTFQLSQDNNSQGTKLVCYEIVQPLHFSKSNLNNLHLETKKWDIDIRHLPLFRLQAIVEIDEQKKQHYSIYTDQQSFSSYLQGDDLFKQVAAYIKSRRKTPDTYPCYITDLDFSQASAGDQIPVIEYWKMKVLLEEKINAAFALL